MPSTVRKWGNSLAVRLPKAMAEQIKLIEGTEITIECIDNSISIRPARRKRRPNRPSLKSLLAKIKPGQRHGEWDKSGPVGKELI